MNLSTTMTPRERFIVWMHLERNVIAQNGREQDQLEDIRQACDLDGIAEIVEAFGRNVSVDHREFTDDRAAAMPVDLTKEELGFLLALLERPMSAGLARFVLPLRRRLAKERDQGGLKAVEP